MRDSDRIIHGLILTIEKLEAQVEKYSNWQLWTLQTIALDPELSRQFMLVLPRLKPELTPEAEEWRSDAAEFIAEKFLSEE